MNRPALIDVEGLMKLYRGSILVALCAIFTPFLYAAPLTIHEWGTFTGFQDEKGSAINGINIDDEPAPSFVYQYGSNPVLVGNKPFGLPLSSPYFTWKGFADTGKEVTLRLETPVLYIYPPAGTAPESIPPLSVHVEFNGGILSQFYPYAKFEDKDSSAPLEKQTSALTWQVKLGGSGAPIASDSAVWTTPRNVGASLVTSNNSQGVPETEKFLFYRGVAQLDAPLVTTESSDGTTTIFRPRICRFGENQFTDAWLVEIRPNGTCAFKQVSLQGPAAVYRPTRQLASLPVLQESDFSTSHLDELKTSMHNALVANGLFDDEATAMLNTWQLSYFKSPGLRLFYVVPSEWTNKALPLTVSGAENKITRVMIGRVELISPFERKILAQLRSGPAPDISALDKAGRMELDKRGIAGAAAEPYLKGDKTLADLGIAIPPLVTAYTQLGRFREALVLHEEAVNPSPELAKFIELNGLALH